MNKILAIRQICLLLLCIWHLTAFAHKPSDSYLVINVQKTEVNGQWDIALRDFDYAIGLDKNENGEITWSEVLNMQNEIYAYAFARFKIFNDQKICTIDPSKMLVDSHTDGVYVVIKFHGVCEGSINFLGLDYRLFANLDPTHSGLLRLEYKNQTETAVLGTEHSFQRFDLSSKSRFKAFKEYLNEGIFHIWNGYDHILFIVSLLIPAVLVRTNKGWQPSTSLKLTTLDVLKIVTAFTIAHSITLTLATLHFVFLPSRWVESTIALSVFLAALNNIFPVILKSRWLVAFVFGLIHGFGFASVLKDLNLVRFDLIEALIGFNLGVEIGQVVILSVYIPISYAIRNTRTYRYMIYYFGSFLIVCIAFIWLIERAFDLKLGF